MKGVYWRAGDYAVGTSSEDVLKPIDEGTFYLTNKRFLFDGCKGNKQILLKNIFDFDAFEDGLRIEKNQGRTPLLEFRQNVDVCAVILSRLLNELN